MSTGTVYRAPKRDRHGDPVDSDGSPVQPSGDGVAKVGTLEGLIFGGQSVRPLPGRGEVASSEGLIGAPRNAAVKLQHGDRLDVDGTRYQVIGPRRFYYPHSITGTDLGLYWVRVEATVN